MSTPNTWTPSQLLQLALSQLDNYEKRIEYDGNNNAIYIFYTTVPNAGVGENVFFGFKNTYDVNNNCTHVQLPNDGFKFVYNWTDRATYFS